jgi:hypothetical protein
VGWPVGQESGAGVEWSGVVLEVSADGQQSDIVLRATAQLG